VGATILRSKRTERVITWSFFTAFAIFLLFGIVAAVLCNSGPARVQFRSINDDNCLSVKLQDSSTDAFGGELLEDGLLAKWVFGDDSARLLLECSKPNGKLAYGRLELGLSGSFTGAVGWMRQFVPLNGSAWILKPILSFFAGDVAIRAFGRPAEDDHTLVAINDAPPGTMSDVHHSSPLIASVPAETRVPFPWPSLSAELLGSAGTSATLFFDDFVGEKLQHGCQLLSSARGVVEILRDGHVLTRARLTPFTIEALRFPEGMDAIQMLFDSGKRTWIGTNGSLGGRDIRAIAYSEVK